MLTMEKMHHPKANTDGLYRLYLPRTQEKEAWSNSNWPSKPPPTGLDTYLPSTEDPLLQLVTHHEHRKKLLLIKKEAAKFKQELNLAPRNTTNRKWSNNEVRPQSKTETKGTRPATGAQGLRGKDNAWHYPKRTKDADVDYVKTNKWLKTHGLKAETEGLIIAAQDQSLATRS